MAIKSIGRLALASAALGLVGAFGPANEAKAAGCGGYVNVAVWGCAPWDNNRGRNAAQEKARKDEAARQAAARAAEQRAAAQRAAAQQAAARQAAAQQAAAQQAARAKLIANDGASMKASNPSGLLSPGNRNPGLIANDGASLRANNARILSDQGGGMRR